MTIVTPYPKGQRRPKPDPEWTMADSVPIVEARSRGRCEHPSGCVERATVFHHRRGRGRGFACHHPSLIAHLCESHHLYAHAHPKASYEDGTMLSRTAECPPLTSGPEWQWARP